MTKNPFYNAITAITYIALVVSLLTFGFSSEITQSNEFLVPLMMISLFTLSAAVMAYIFLSQPIRMYLDNKKEEAVKLFLRTVAIFAGITVFIFVLFFLGVF